MSATAQNKEAAQAVIKSVFWSSRGSDPQIQRHGARELGITHLLAGARPPLDRRVVITALGIAQILAWGTSFYFPAVFAEPIVKETGWSLGFVVGGTSIGLLTAGLISPQVGRIIDVRGGRPVLLASSLFYAAGLALVGLSQALPVYLLAWVLIGFGMGTGLYDAVFAALGRMYGSEARGPITSLTLFGGFAGTICWPLSAFMIEHFGWRNACFVYAAHSSVGDAAAAGQRRARASHHRDCSGWRGCRR